MIENKVNYKLALSLRYCGRNTVYGINRGTPMSNKKLFWLAFIVLSICELGQFAYSQNSAPADEMNKTRPSTLHCNDELSLSVTPENFIQSASYALPR